MVITPSGALGHEPLRSPNEPLTAFIGTQLNNQPTMNATSLLLRIQAHLFIDALSEDALGIASQNAWTDCEYLLYALNCDDDWDEPYDPFYD